MWDPLEDLGQAADFWAPKPSGFWRVVLSPVRKFYLKAYYGIGRVEVEGVERLSVIPENDGVLLTPNHSHDSDPHVMMDVAARLDRQFYFMAAWQIFKGRKGVDGFVLQRMGAFSVDREGCDRKAMRQAMDLMSEGRWVVIFPEGEVYRTNDRLTPLREGVAFMACAAQRELGKEERSEVSDQKSGGRRIWIVPTAIRYRYLDDIRPDLEDAMDALEERVVMKGTRGRPLEQRILRFGEAMLTIKEKEQVGRSCEDEGDLPARLRCLIGAMLDRLEGQWLEKAAGEGSVSERVKGLRQKLLEIWADPAAPEARRAEVRTALDDVQLAMQLYSYPGDYVSEHPSVERMAETIEKFDEDVFGEPAKPKGKRAARVILGDPIDVGAATAADRPRVAATKLTKRLEGEIRGLMGSPAGVVAKPE